MFQFRGVRRVIALLSALTVLFTIYQFSYSVLNTHIPNENGILLDLMDDIKIKKSSLNGRKIDSLGLETQGLGNNIYPQNSNTGINKNFIVKDKLTSKIPGPPLFSGAKIVHIDLKGAPPKISYYKEFLPLIKNLGATGVLIEYEDMFPYTIGNISATNSYTTDDIKYLVKLAEENNLEVIPLVQTFGHMEFVLKLEEYEYLREVSKYPQVICPSRNGTASLLKGMIDDIVSLHPNSKYIHIGCDEVYNLGECTQCVETMLKKNWTKQQLFLNHVTMLAKYIKNKYPNVKTMTWDDEFRKMTLQELMASEIGNLVVPVVWKYTPTIDNYLTDEMWEKYSGTFKSIWIASAFKGATGPDKFVTDIEYHLENHRAWMKLVNDKQHWLSFNGIMITGWQRYDHFAVLCELLPVGLPSLAVNLAFISQSDIELQRVPPLAQEKLKCGPGLLHPKLGAHCNFPGSRVYEKANQLESLVEQISEMEATSEAKGWLTDYNVHTGFSSPVHVEGATSDLDRYKMELMYLEQDMRKSMDEVFYSDTVDEWVYTFITPVNKRLRSLWENREQLLAHKVWPRRPLYMNNRDL